MAITSQVTGQPIFGSNPAGFTPLVPNNNGGNQYILTNRTDLTFDYSDLTFTLNDIPATQASFLAMVKDELDTVYLPSVFTDATKTYTAEYVVNAVRLDFFGVTGSTTSDRSIWTEREYKWLVNVTVKVNVN
jgi:hypothetical protein